MNKIIRQKLANSKRRIRRRLDKTDLRGCSQPMMTARNIQYEIAGRSRGISVGGTRSSPKKAMLTHLRARDALPDNQLLWAGLINECPKSTYVCFGIKGDHRKR